MNQVTYKQRVIDLAKKNPAGITTKDVKREVKGITPTTMYALLWTMKKAGILVHDREANVYKLAGVLTAVNKSPEPEAKPEPKATPLPPKGSYEREIRELTFRVSQLNAHITTQHNQLTDALAVIRYLEGKLFKAIQFDARNGGNS
jgi:hypothetical protein